MEFVAGEVKAAANFSCYSSMDDPFESALSSMVSSPAASAANAENSNIVLKELIGRLDTIYNSNAASCYTTPLSSPPKISPAARFSFPESDPNLESGSARVLSSKIQHGFDDSMECSSISVFQANSRKRKASASPIGKGKGSKDAATALSRSNIKRTKSGQEDDDEEEAPPKDYIHVRARRGQATDAHSLAERVRREKISERMKILQSLVPGCSKVTGKAVMLDEIINYVQSLQRQVEFLSMKLATINQRVEMNTETPVCKDVNVMMHQSCGSFYHNMMYHPLESYSFHSHPTICGSTTGHLLSSSQSQTADGVLQQVWDGELHSVVQMGFRETHNQTAKLSGQQHSK